MQGLLCSFSFIQIIVIVVVVAVSVVVFVVVCVICTPSKKNLFSKFLGIHMPVMDNCILTQSIFCASID